jgi:hypothetical protein
MTTKMMTMAVLLATVGCAASGDDPEPGGVGPSAMTVLDDLTVAPEAAAGTYDRDLFGGWETVDGCSTRERVLIDRSEVAATVGDDCDVVAGRWDGLADPDKIEIDHVVSLAEAWRSGASEWSDDQRREFSNDHLNLQPLPAAVNQAKSDLQPGEWLPPVPAEACEYVAVYVDVKQTWELSVDETEHAALEDVAAGC